MRMTVFSLLLAAAWPAAVSLADDPIRLEIAAEPAVVTITPLAGGRRLIRLPALEFRLDITARCPADRVAKSVSISVADTSKTLGREAFDGDSFVRAEISIPPKQVAPLAVDGFCPLEGESQHDSLLIRDAVTAHLSLRCTGPHGDEIGYATHGLDVTLRCEAADQGATLASMAR